MSSSLRQVRINALLRRVISEFLHKNFTDEAAAITITRVAIASDLKKADVYFSVYQPEAKNPAFVFLKKQRNHVQWAIHKEMRLKYTPRLFFAWDAEWEKMQQTLDLLNKMDEQQGSDEGLKAIDSSEVTDGVAHDAG